MFRKKLLPPSSVLKNKAYVLSSLTVCFSFLKMGQAVFYLRSGYTYCEPGPLSGYYFGGIWKLVENVKVRLLKENLCQYALLLTLSQVNTHFRLYFYMATQVYFQLPLAWEE